MDTCGCHAPTCMCLWMSDWVGVLTIGAIAIATAIWWVLVCV